MTPVPERLSIQKIFALKIMGLTQIIRIVTTQITPIKTIIRKHIMVPSTAIILTMAITTIRQQHYQQRPTTIATIIHTHIKVIIRIVIITATHIQHTLPTMVRAIVKTILARIIMIRTAHSEVLAVTK